ncbi:MAG: molecular chaperone [Sphingomonadales bacterium]|nr:molecular chaperone [Sphingomonadales bacterium]
MKRFYRAAGVGEAEGGWRVLLDGRPVKSVGGRPQIVPCRALAAALAAEWADQGEEIAPARFVLRDLADYAIDVVGADRAAAIRALVAYAETDTLCYRAGPDEPLWHRQVAVWEPILATAEARHGVRFERICGIIHRPQPEATLLRLGEELVTHDDFTLAALASLAGLAASLVVALAAIVPDADIAGLWSAAHLEEAWQAELWGRDPDAMARQARRAALFAAAAQMARMLLNPHES